MKVTILQKEIYRFNAITNKILTWLFTEIGKVNKEVTKFMWEYKEFWVAQTILANNNTAGNITIPYLKPYYRALLVKDGIASGLKEPINGLVE